MAKVMIDISDETYDKIKNSGSDSKCTESVLLDAVESIKNGTKLGQYGDSVGMLFCDVYPPSVYYEHNGVHTVLLARDVILKCANEEWWSAKYGEYRDPLNDKDGE